MLLRVKQAPFWVLLIFIILCVYRAPFIDARQGMAFITNVGIVAAVAILIMSKANPWIGLFLVLAFRGAYLPVCTPQSVEAFIGVFVMLSWYLAVVLLFNKEKTEWLKDALLVVAVGNVLFLVMQTAGFDPLWNHKGGGGFFPVGLMDNQNNTAAVLAFCLPAAIRPNRRWLFVPVILLGLILTKTSMGVVSAAAGFLYVLIQLKQWKWAVALPIGMVGFYFIFIDAPGIYPRLAVLERAWTLFQYHPWLGAGLGHWKTISLKMLPGPIWYQQMHNDIAQAVFELGIGFFVVLGGFIWRFWSRCKRADVPSMAVVIIAVNSLGHFPFHMAVPALIAVTWLAIWDIETRNGGMS